MAFDREALYQEIKSNSNIINGDEWREVVTAIANVAADAVSTTLGPYGATTVIDDGSGFTYPTKDGWASLSRLHFTDPMYNTILAMLKKISFNSASTVGDGTTTAMEVTKNFLNEFSRIYKKYTDNNKQFSQYAFLQAIKKVSSMVEDRLINNPNIHKIDIDTDEGIESIGKVANIAANGNAEISDIICEIYKQSKNPHIHVSMDGEDKTTYEIQKGYKFDAKPFNFPIYMNDEHGIIRHIDKPRNVVIFDHNVTYQSHEKIIGAITNLNDKMKMETVIMAPYFDDILSGMVSSMIQNIAKSGGMPSIMFVQVPVTMELHRKTLSDLCVLTNAQLFTDAKVKVFNIMTHNATQPEENKIEDSLLSLPEYAFNSIDDLLMSCIGTMRSVIFKKTEAFLQDYENIMNRQKYNATVLEAEEAYKYLKNKAGKTVGGMLDKDYLFAQLRYIKLKGETGVINVGGISEIQKMCDKDTIDDAVLACRSAYENGYVRGLNLEILTILDSMIDEEKLFVNNRYEEYASHLLDSAFYYTTKKVIENMGCSWEEPLANIVPPGTELQNETFTPKMIIDMCIGNGDNLDYNIRTFRVNYPENWTVVNSAQTDIEILRAVVNTLSTVISSAQFLSMTRRFDPKITSERGLEQRLKEEKIIYKNRAEATVEGIVDTNIRGGNIVDIIRSITNQSNTLL